MCRETIEGIFTRDVLSYWVMDWKIKRRFRFQNRFIVAQLKIVSFQFKYNTRILYIGIALVSRTTGCVKN